MWGEPRLLPCQAQRSCRLSPASAADNLGDSNLLRDKILILAELYLLFGEAEKSACPAPVRMVKPSVR